jgi:hypothetical protein
MKITTNSPQKKNILISPGEDMNMKQNCSQPNSDVRIKAAFSLKHNIVQQKVLQNVTSLQMFMNRFQVLLHKSHVSFPVPLLGSGLKVATIYLTHFYCGTCFHTYWTTCNINYVSKWLSKHTRLIFKNCHL